ncbi:MAG: competence/damage-inducible protein A [Flavobacteriales bacterium]|jgi:nicotinamide-nucleotide amidase
MERMPEKATTAECLCIGDELLIGQTVNTNAAWMGEQLSLIGIRPVLTRVVGDNPERIREALSTATADVVLITGGLGPTKDDITKHVLSDFFGMKLVHHPAVEAHITALFTRMGRDPREVKQADLAQAMLPADCTVLPNELGTASGMWFDRAGRVFVSMPGVPYEMEGLMTASVLPKLKERFRPANILHRTIKTTGMGETQLAQRIADWETGLALDDVALAYLPSPGLVKLRLSTYAGLDPEEARERIDRQAAALYKLVPELIYGEGQLRLEEAIGLLLKERGYTLALAESCTGGYLSHLVTSVPGSSAYYIGGVVSYANAVKMVELGIPSDMLELNGAVSKPVVERMAEGVRQALRSDWAVATTGVAGPEGGTPEKPVGTVWLAVAGPDGVTSSVGVFMGTRPLVIRRSAIAALNMLRKRLLKAQKAVPQL